MAKYHATMVDETGCEFGSTLDVDDNVENVTEYFRDMYPESSILFIEPLHGVSTAREQAHDRWQDLWDSGEQDLY